MQPVGRKRLPHEIPPEVITSPLGEVFFVTICCQQRGPNQLARPEVWDVLEDTLVHREQTGEWRVLTALAMPDHFHGLFEFPGDKSMRRVVAAFKSWVARRAGIMWQRDFFDHRIRSWESGAEKAEYIRQNPVRAGLVQCPADWPYQFPR